MKHHQTEENLSQFKPGQDSSVAQSSLHQAKARLTKGFAKVVAGGRIVRLQNENLFWKEWSRVESPFNLKQMTTGTHEQAVLESVASNLEAGIEMVGHQEVCLAKIGGRLSEIAFLSIMHETPSVVTRIECPCRFDSNHRETKSENWLYQLLTIRPCSQKVRPSLLPLPCRLTESGRASQLTVPISSNLA